MNRRVIAKFTWVLLIFPGICLIIPMFLVPILFILVISLYTYSPTFTTGTLPLTLENYLNFINSPLFLKIIITTLQVAITTTIFSLIIGYLVAYYIVRIKSAILRQFLIVLVVLTFLLSWIPRLFAWIIILGRNGLLESLFGFYLQLLGTPTGVIIGLIHSLAPLAALVLINPIKNVDPSLIEAARSLGASRFRSFFTILLPLTIPGIISAILLVYTISVSAFVTPEILGQGVVLMMPNLIYYWFGQTLNFPYGSAIAGVLFVLSVGTSYLIGWLLNRFHKWEE